MFLCIEKVPTYPPFTIHCLPSNKSMRHRQDTHMQSCLSQYPVRYRKIASAARVYLAPTPLFPCSGLLLEARGSCTPIAPLRINLLFFKYSSTSLSTLPLSCFGFLSPTDQHSPCLQASSQADTKKMKEKREHIPHIIQPRPPRPLLRPLHNLQTPHIRAVDLNPHLHPNSQNPVPQQHPRVHAPSPDTQTHPGEGIPRLEIHEQDVPRLGRIGVVALEEPCARAGGVEQRDLRCGVGV